MEDGRKPLAPGSGWEGCIAVYRDPVGRGEGERFGRRKREVGECGLVSEEEGGALGVAFVEEVADGRGIVLVGDDPARVRVVARRDVEITVVGGTQGFDVTSNCGVEHDDVGTVAFDRRDLRVAALRMQRRARDVVSGVFEQDLYRSGRQVDAHQTCRVRVDGAQHVERFALCIEAQHATGIERRVLGCDGEDYRPRTRIAVTEEVFERAGGRRTPAAAHREVEIDEPLVEPRIRHDLVEGAAREIESIDVVEPAVVRVDLDEQFMWLAPRAPCESSLRAVERRPVDDLATCDVATHQVDGVEVPVLVAVHVLDVEEMTVVVRPAVRADPALDVRSDRSRVVGRHRPDPDVQHSVDRPQVREPLAVWREARARPLGIPEQHLQRNAFDQLCLQ